MLEPQPSERAYCNTGLDEVFFKHFIYSDCPFMQSTMSVEQSNSGDIDRDKHGLCLLSLGTIDFSTNEVGENPRDTDGGGVRGLSTPYILQGLMRCVNAK